MRKNELFFPSADKKTNIHMVIWEPEDEVLGAIEIVHGVTEYVMRYEELAQYLTDKGIVVVGIDLLGHGLSTDNGNKVMYFGENGSWNYVVDDVDSCLLHAKQMYPNVPCVMLGFSLGSFVVRTHMIDKPGVADGIILIGTGIVDNFKITLAQNIVKKEIKKYGDEVATDKIRDLTFGVYNKQFKPNRTEYDWLCANEEVIDQYDVDPLVGKNMSNGLFRELLYGIKYTGDRSNILKVDKNKPVLFLSGDKDAVGGFGKNIFKLYSLFKDSGIENVSIKMYENLRHDILHEKNKEMIFEDIYNWIVERYLVKSSLNEMKEENKKDEKSTIVDNDKVESVLLRNMKD